MTHSCLAATKKKLQSGKATDSREAYIKMIHIYIYYFDENKDRTTETILMDRDNQLAESMT